MKIQSLLRLTFLIVCFSWMVNIQVSATHIVGGEFYYEHQGGNDYLVTLIVYRDCGPDNVNDTGFDDTAPIGVYAGSTFYDTYYFSLSNAMVNFVPLSLDNPCFTPPLDLCVEQAIYQEVITLPDNAVGYDLVYQRCCRNNSIVNIVDAADSGISIYSHVPGTDEVEGNNSAPIFNNSPTVALCLGAEFFFDHSATDADGDELTYEFYAPYLGGGPDGVPPGLDSPSPDPPSAPNFPSVSWNGGYNDNYQLDSAPAFSIDASTGLITGTATQLGRYAIGVAVHEYRNGILINTTYRDIQYTVTICDPTIVAALTVDEQLYCEGLTFEFINESVNGGEFYWDFGDPNTDNDNSTDENPTYTYSEAGTYNVMLIANPGWFCADTAYAEYEAVTALNVLIEVSDFNCINGENVYSFGTVGENPPTSTYAWDFGENATPQFSSEINPGEVVFDGIGVQDISVVVTDFECENTQQESIEIPPPPIPSIGAQDDFCSGLTMIFANNTEGAETYNWSFGDPQNNNDNSTLFEPTYTFSDYGVFQVTLEASIPLTCPVSTTEEFTILPILDAFFESPGGACLSDNSFNLQFGGSATNSTLFYWDFGIAQPGSSNLVDPPSFSFSEAGTFPVSLTITNEFCEKEYTDSAFVFLDPTIGFDIGSAIGCQPLKVSFEDNSFSENTLYYLWDFGDGGQSTSPNPKYIYENSGVFDVTLTAYTLSGCIATLTQTNTEAVIVQPKPISNFHIVPAVVDILDPNFDVFDLSEGANAVAYYLEEELISIDFEFPYSIQESGEHFLTQEVISENGCKSESIFAVTVSGHLIYIPSAFSPNDDGVNDYFKIISTGISEFNISIYNRWGTIVYHSNNVDDIWSGDVRDAGDYYGQNESYIYHITYKGQFSSEAEDIVGQVVVIR